jgi:hypothetical protein
MKQNRLALSALLCAAIASLPGCGGGTSTDDSSSDALASAPSPAPTPAPAPSAATLSWGAPGDTDVTNYRVYYGTASGSYVQTFGSGVNVGNKRSFTATGLLSGQRYFFAVTAVDAAGNESAYSAEVSKVVQ